MDSKVRDWHNTGVKPSVFNGQTQANIKGMAEAKLRRGLSTSWGLGQWVRQEMTEEADEAFAVRVITNELDKWDKLKLTDQEIQAHANQGPDSGDPRFDALIEGLVARIFDIRGLKRPQWTSKTHLSDVWWPHADQYRTQNTMALVVLRTPVTLLDRGIIMDRKASERLSGFCVEVPRL